MKMKLNELSVVPRAKLAEDIGDYLVVRFYPNGGEYPIDWDRINTPEKLLGWIFHLSKKNNVKKEHLTALIEVAHAKGVPIGFHA